MKISVRSKVFGLLFLLVALATVNIIGHDFFCHDELHHLLSPVHHTFTHPLFNSIDLIQPCLWQSNKIYLEYSSVISADFVPTIYHPPN